MLVFDWKATPLTRATNVLQLITVQTMLMFMIAVFYDVEIPQDDGFCESLTSQASCEQRKSLFNSDKSQCNWSSEMQRCQYMEVAMTWQVQFIILIKLALVFC
jgi:hypothetical protein